MTPSEEVLAEQIAAIEELLRLQDEWQQLCAAEREAHERAERVRMKISNAEAGPQKLGVGRSVQTRYVRLSDGTLVRVEWRASIGDKGFVGVARIAVEELPFARGGTDTAP